MRHIFSIFSPPVRGAGNLFVARPLIRAACISLVPQEALDAMASKVETARDKWELESYVVQQRNKDVLMEFGLSHAAF